MAREVLVGALLIAVSLAVAVMLNRSAGREAQMRHEPAESREMPAPATSEDGTGKADGVGD